MLEGKEVEVKIGNYGAASVDVDAKGFVEVAVGIKVDLLAELEKLAAKTKTTLDDKFIATVKMLMGRE